MAYVKRSRKPARKQVKRRPAMRRRVPSTRTNVPEWASLTCTRTLTVAAGEPGATVTDQMYNYNTFALADFDRAVQVAGAYQQYRITGITLRFKPAYDTYQQNAPGATANTQKPNLYFVVDKSDSIPDTVTLEGLKNLGARPKSFDERPISVTWRPAVTIGNQVSTGPAISGSMFKVSPWLSTNVLPGQAGWNPSNIAHKGIKWYMEQPGAGTGETTVYVEVEVQFQFKKPLVDGMTGMTSAVGIHYPKLDLSPDGIEGGSDGITIPKLA